jgi:GNAT superfamily N-acetyltransferase
MADDAQTTSTVVEIVPFHASLRTHFYRLNAQWLEKHFHIEDIDCRLLGDPETYVLQPGGAIFFARLGDQIIGTCALLRESAGVYELSKMGVDESFRGRGAGRRLLNAAVAEFHRRDGQMLFLESSSLLTTALRMYEQVGFVMQPAIRAGSHYQRADVYMVYQPATGSI